VSSNRSAVTDDCFCRFGRRRFGRRGGGIDGVAG
jgi:hypothetical protein